MVFDLKSWAKVASVLANDPFMNRLTRHVLPTEASPSITILKETALVEELDDLLSTINFY